MNVRADVVDALVEVFQTGNAEGAPTDATPAERDHVDRVIDDLLAGRGVIGPTDLARRALIQAYRPGDDWGDMFDRLSGSEVDRLRALFPYMPPRAARHFAERFVIPTGNQAGEPARRH